MGSTPKGEPLFIIYNLLLSFQKIFKFIIRNWENKTTKECAQAQTSWQFLTLNTQNRNSLVWKTIEPTFNRSCQNFSINSNYLAIRGAKSSYSLIYFIVSIGSKLIQFSEYLSNKINNWILSSKEMEWYGFGFFLSIWVTLGGWGWPSFSWR